MQGADDFALWLAGRGQAGKVSGCCVGVRWWSAEAGTVSWFAFKRTVLLIFDTFDDEVRHDAHLSRIGGGLDGKGQGGRSVAKAPEIYKLGFWRTNFQDETRPERAQRKAPRPRHALSIVGSAKRQCPPS